jgi:HlyD family secretion protein
MRKRWVVLVAAVLAVGAGGWFAATAPDEDDVVWAEARLADLVLGVEVEGILRSTDSSMLGAPQVPDMWDFKISFMAPEGEKVEKGAPVLGFETTELDRRLREMEAESEEAAKEIEKKAKALEDQRKEDALKLAEAEAKLRKAEMKLETPESLEGARDLENARLDRELADVELNHLRDRIASSRESGEAALAVLESRKARADRRVREYREGIEMMTVKAPRDGTVIYTTEWNGQKKKVGDSCWRGHEVIELPDLTAMMARGEVDEADAAQVAPGQGFRIRLDAHPDVEFTGTVSSIRRTVGRKSWRNPLKVVLLEMELEETDTRRMRPGMRFRGTVETDRLEDVLVIPIEAVFPKPEGPAVYRGTLFGYEKVTVKLGRRNDRYVRILEGLEEGDRVAERDLELRERG